MIPVIETQDGTFFHESRVVMDFAHEFGGDKGLHLYPSDPVKAALLRLDVEHYLKFSWGQHFFTLLLEKEEQKHHQHITALRESIG